jgi:hypothetical protein
LTLNVRGAGGVVAACAALAVAATDRVAPGDDGTVTVAGTVATADTGSRTPVLGTGVAHPDANRAAAHRRPTAHGSTA